MHHMLRTRRLASNNAETIASGLRSWLDASVASPPKRVRKAPAAPNSLRPPPWVSKSRLNKAGEAIRTGQVTAEDALVVDAWRGSHRYVLNVFQSILRQRARRSGVIVAQRLKRRFTIADKLSREPHMQLARMDDLAGCRLIFPDLESLREFRAQFHRARFLHKRKNDPGKYDYIQHPKQLGYRGIHDIYEFTTGSRKGARYNGLLLELQYRTQCQHAWATAVELVSHFTGYEPKFERGDPRHVEFFRLASEVIARTRELGTSCYPALPNSTVAHRLEEIDSETHLLSMLRRAQPSRLQAADESALLLQIGADSILKIHEYANMNKATAEYFKFEKEFPRDDIVLVNADTFASIRTTYRNYFRDVGDFVTFIDEGCRALKA